MQAGKWSIYGNRWCRLLLLFLVYIVQTGDSAQISELNAFYRSGQVFITWKEPAVDSGTLFIIYSSSNQISSLNAMDVKRVSDVCRKSATDWWKDPDKYLSDSPYPIGFIIEDGGTPIIADGLFVHTVTFNEEGNRYYSVVVKDTNGVIDSSISAGQNTLTQPVEQRVAPIEPIWQEGLNDKPLPGSGVGKTIRLFLHAKGGSGLKHFLAFGDSSMGWREGLPFKFGVENSQYADYIKIRPNDQAWIRRILTEANDGYNKINPAIHTFWYGYNNKIINPDSMSSGISVNYTERILLWMLDWAKRYYSPDTNRTYLFGSSMGGCGGISFGLRHPEIFAGISVHVPNPSYHENNAWRLTAYCGPLSILTNEQVSLENRMDGPLFVENNRNRNLPYLVIVNGRNDGSIPWENVPAFYHSLNNSRHGYIAAWNNGNHSGTVPLVPDDIYVYTYCNGFGEDIALNKSYPAFSRSSADEDPGNGDSANGDIAGYMNRGLKWRNVMDSSNMWKVDIIPDTMLQLPITVDITIRRPQRFLPVAGTMLNAVNIALSDSTAIQDKEIYVDDDNLATITEYQLTSMLGNRLVVNNTLSKIDENARKTSRKGIDITVFPNPFNPSVTLDFTEKQKNANIEIRIYNAKGVLVDDLTSIVQNIRTYSPIVWKADKCPSGIYVIKVKAGKKVLSKTITLLR